jgi:cell division protein FtsZ
VICLPNQRLIRLLDGHTSAVDTFKFGNRLLGQAVHSLWRLLTRPALIRVDLPDVRQLLKNHPGDSLFATASGQGTSRANDAVDQLLASPLLDPPKRITESSAMLVSIVGGRDLTMAEVNRVVERISRQGEDLHIVLGAAIDDEFTERLEIAGFLLGQARLEEQALPAANPAASAPPQPSRAPEATGSELNTHALEESNVRPPSRLVPPAPALTQERAEILMCRQTGSPTRSRKLANKYMQGQLPLEIVSKGRFEKSDPTFHKGEDLDLPTFIRKRVPLN